MLYYLIAFCAIAVLGASAQKQTSYGVTQNEAPESLSCPKVRPFYVNLNRMTGRWFLQLISSNTGLQHDTETCKRDFWNQPNGNKAQVILSAYSPVLGGYSEVVTDLSFNANTYNMTIVVPIIENINVKHSILDTDYYSYAIYYACITDGSNSVPGIWVKTRDQFPRFSVRNVAQNALRRNGFPYLDFSQSSQQNC